MRSRARTHPDHSLPTQAQVDAGKVVPDEAQKEKLSRADALRAEIEETRAMIARAENPQAESEAGASTPPGEHGDEENGEKDADALGAEGEHSDGAEGQGTGEEGDDQDDGEYVPDVSGLAVGDDVAGDDDGRHAGACWTECMQELFVQLLLYARERCGRFRTCV